MEAKDRRIGEGERWQDIVERQRRNVLWKEARGFV